MLLALDPSSTRTGYAVFDSAGKIAEAGYLNPRFATDKAWDRIASMIEDLAELLRATAPRRIVIEVPSGKVGGGQRRGAGASLCIYGFAVGAIWATCRSATCNPTTDEVDERSWTLRVPKEIRRSRVAAEFPEYRKVMSKDGGGDVADAIGIGLWWIEQRRIRDGSARI